MRVPYLVAIATFGILACAVLAASPVAEERMTYQSGVLASAGAEGTGEAAAQTEAYFASASPVPSAPASTEHTSPPDARSAPAELGRSSTDRSHDLDITLKLGLDGFRLGGRLFGDPGVAGRWLLGLCAK